MRNAQYLRARAELCLELARNISDRTAAETLLAEAARYQAEAAEEEARQANPRASRWAAEGRAN